MLRLSSSPLARSDRSHWLRTHATLVGLGVIMLGALLLRLVWLDADAAPTLSWSGAPYTDEGLYSHAARNKVLFGTWRTDEWDNRLVSPLFDGLAFAVYSVFGVGYVQLRSISVVFALVALPVFWDLLRRDLGSDWALLGAAVWSFDYFWFQYSRLGLLEPSMVTWLVLAAWCWRRGVDRGAAWFVTAGMCAAIAYVWKSLALVFVPVPLIALLLLDRRAWRWASAYLIGCASVLVVFTLVWYLPHAAELTRYNRFYAADRFPESVSALWRSVAQNVRSRYVWAQTPIVLAVAIIGALRAIRCGRRLVQTPGVLVCLVWAGCGTALLIMPYSPPRYYTLLVPPLVGLAIFALRELVTRLGVRWCRVVVLACVCACTLWNGWWYVRWAATRQSTLAASSQAIAALVPQGEMVLGVTACGLSLANTLPCAPPFAGLVNDHAPVATLGARYAVVEQSPDDYMRRMYGPLLRRSTRLGQFALGPRRVTLYRLAVDDDVAP